MLTMFKLTLALVGLTLSLSANAALYQYQSVGTTPLTGSFTFDDQTLQFSNVSLMAVSIPVTFDSITSNLVMDGAGANPFATGGIVLLSSGSPNILAYQSGPQIAYCGVNALEQCGSGLLGAFGMNLNMVIDNTPSGTLDGNLYFSTSEVPIPAAAWLFGSALIGLAGIKRKK